MRIPPEIISIEIAKSGTIQPFAGDHALKRSRYKEEKIAFALKRDALGTPVQEACREMCVSDVKFYCFRERYGGPQPLNYYTPSMIQIGLQCDRTPTPTASNGSRQTPSLCANLLNSNTS